MKELKKTIKILESKLPANPVSPENERLSKSLERDLKLYFQKLSDALPIEGLEELYYKHVGELPPINEALYVKEAELIPIQGEKGDKGEKGADGLKGDRGADGKDGAKGDEGEKGDTGDCGASGQQGEQGEQGIQGPQGERGDQGPKGVDGKDGTSDLSPDVVDALDGTHGKPSIKNKYVTNSDPRLKDKPVPKHDDIVGIGYPGPRGPQGDEGPAGADGADGVDGADGLPGPNEVTVATATDLVGFLLGDGANIATADSMSYDAVTGDVTINADVILEGLEFTEDAAELHFLDSLGFYGRDTELAVRIGSERVDAGTLIPFLAGLDVDARSLRIQDYYGGTGIAFNVIDVIPTAPFFGFDLYGYSAFSINEPVTGVGETSLGCGFTAVERGSGAAPIAFVLQSDFGGHRFQVGDVGANCNFLPTFEFAATGGYDDAASEENPRFVFQAQDAGAGVWWIRAYPKPVDSGWAEGFDPLGFMFGDGASLKGLHGGDVVITPTSAYGADIGGNLEVQGDSYLGEMLVRADGTMQPASMADASAANNSIYYSTTQGKLVYKDAAGVVNNLY